MAVQFEKTFCIKNCTKKLYNKSMCLIELLTLKSENNNIYKTFARNNSNDMYVE